MGIGQKIISRATKKLGDLHQDTDFDDPLGEWKYKFAESKAVWRDVVISVLEEEYPDLLTEDLIKDLRIAIEVSSSIGPEERKSMGEQDGSR